jgi:hypothetical protein
MSADPQLLATVFVRVEDTGFGDRHTYAKYGGPNFQLPAVWLCELGICRGCRPDLGRRDHED